MKTERQCILHQLVSILVCSIVCTICFGQSRLSDVDVLRGTAYPSSAKMNPDFVPGLATGGLRGYYSLFGEDLANLCIQYGSPISGEIGAWKRNPRFVIDSKRSQGSFDNIFQLVDRGGGVHLALVQSDVWLHLQNQLLQQSKESDPAAWKSIERSIKLLLPLFTEAIHVVVRTEDVATGKYVDLISLFESKVHVNVGESGSGTSITAGLLRRIISASVETSSGPTATVEWNVSNKSDDDALRSLWVKDDSNKKPELDAVLLVGATTNPALDRLFLEWSKSKTEKDSQKLPLSLLPFGRADSILDRFQGFHYPKTTISANEYPYLENEGDVSTRGVTACLVSFDSPSVTADDRQAMLWIRHIVKRILSKHDPSSKTGLVRDFGSPQAGRLWKQLRPPEDWSVFGWERHEDLIIRELIELWEAQNDPMPLSRILLDPDG